MDTLAIVLRVILSLAVVFAILWLSHRVASNRTGTKRGRGADTITVVARQGLTQKTAAFLVDAAGKRYLLGVAEGQVTLLDTLEQPAESFASALDQAGAEQPAGGLWVPTPRPAAPAPDAGPVQRAAEDAPDLGGESLRPISTWRKAAMQVMKGKATA